MLKNRRGEMALRVARRRAKRQGDTELLGKLDHILADPGRTEIAGAVLEEEAAPKQKGGLFRDILNWIVSNPQQFKDLISFIIGLFSGIASADVSPVKTFGVVTSIHRIDELKTAVDDLGKMIDDDLPAPGTA